MKYSCKVIEDLLPLYYDDVCSDESRRIIEEHFLECESCRCHYNSLNEADSAIDDMVYTEEEICKASFLKKMKHKVIAKQIIAGAVAILLVVGLLVTSVSVLKNKELVVKYQNNVSVSMKDGALVGRLTGSTHTQMRAKRVSAGGEEYLFFCLYRTKWDELAVNDRLYSEFVLCPEDKGAGKIDRVYYYVGDDTGLESMEPKQLTAIIEQSSLLWSK